MRFVKPVLQALLIILVIAISLFGYHYLTTQLTDIPEVINQPQPTPSPPDLTTLAAKLQQQTQVNRPEEELIIDQQQIAVANQWLYDNNFEQRLAGVQQLSAYPSKHSEQLLSETLQGDASPEVRAAAAFALFAFKELSTDTLALLIKALQDEQSVSRNALDVLRQQLSHQQPNSNSYQFIVKSLKDKLKNKSVSLDTQDSINELLSEHGVK